MNSDGLKKAGLKVTLPRLKIISILEQNPEDHLSAEEVFKALQASGEDVGLATVYRVLTQFEAAGLVKRVHFEGGHALFELDLGEHHDHIVCVQCGHVVEFVDAAIEKRQERIARDHEFEIADHTLVLYGECQRKLCPNKAD